MTCLFHRWAAVDDSSHAECGACFHAQGRCPHAFRVCRKCGKAVGYGSHGKLSVVPDGCKRQIEAMGGRA